jgi:hypothetical protein
LVIGVIASAKKISGFVAPRFPRRKKMPTLQPIRSLCGPLQYSSYVRQVYYLGDRDGLVPGTERTVGVLLPG